MPHTVFPVKLPCLLLSSALLDSFLLGSVCFSSKFIPTEGNNILLSYFAKFSYLVYLQCSNGMMKNAIKLRSPFFMNADMGCCHVAC